MLHSWWSYNKTATPRRRENPDFSREIKLSDSDVWVPTTTLLCSIFLPVLVKAIPCIGKDLGMSTIAYASLMVELWQEMATLKDKQNPTFQGKASISTHSSSVTVLAIHLTNIKHLLLQHLNAAIPPLDGPTCPKVDLILRFLPKNMPTSG